jgi:DNA-binding CsgD family transcriptional regulator
MKFRRLDYASIVADYQTGHSVSAIAEDHQTTHAAIYRVLNRAGVRPIASRTPDRDDAILLDYRAGLPTEEIAERHHVSPAIVHYLADRAGVVKTSPLARETADAIVVACKMGMTTARIADNLGLHPQSVSAVLSRTIPRAERYPLIVGGIRSLHTQGLSPEDISIRTGRSLQRVSAIISRSDDYHAVRDRARTMRAHGLSFARIGLELGISTMTAYRYAMSMPPKEE